MKFGTLIAQSALPESVKKELIAQGGDWEVPAPRLPTTREIELEAENRALRRRLAQAE